MKEFRIFGVCLLLSIWLFGCQKEMEVKAPEVGVSDTMKLYLSAIKEQDGLEMSKYTEQEHGLDFRIEEADAQALGMNIETAQDLYQYVLDFNYTLDPEAIQEQTASIVVHVSAYPIDETLNKAVEEHKEEFGEINGEDLNEEEKNNKIAAILVSSFANAEKTYTFDYTFHLTLVDQVWKIKEEDGEEFYQALFAQE